MIKWIKARIPSVLASITLLGACYLGLILYGQHAINRELGRHHLKAAIIYERVFWNTETGDLTISCGVELEGSDSPTYGFWGLFSGEVQFLVFHNDTFAEVLQAQDVAGREDHSP